MANNNKKNAAAAAAAKANKQEAPKTETTAKDPFMTGVEEVMNKSRSNMSPDGKAIVANLVQKRYVENENVPQSIRDGADVVVDALLADIIVTNVVEGKEMFALIIRKDENKYLALSAMLASQGITMPAFNALPAPTKEQLEKAGAKLLPSETVVVEVSKENIAPETIEKKKKEKAIVDSKPTDDPTKVENEEQLKASLSNVMISGSENPFSKLNKAINFYIGYLKAQADKSDKKDELLKEIEETSRQDMLKTIANIIGPCPMSMNGFGYLLRKTALETKSVVSPFCLLRRAAANATIGATKDDSIVADMCKIIIIWSCESSIAEHEKAIASLEKTLPKLKGDQKSATDLVIKNKKESIEEIKTVIEIASNPSFDVANNLIENYNSKDTDSDEYKTARRIVANIMDTYYKGIDRNKVSDEEAMLKNAQNHVGVITNMFVDPLAQSIAYKDVTFAELSEKPDSEETKEEEAPAKN